MPKFNLSRLNNIKFLCITRTILKNYFWLTDYCVTIGTYCVPMIHLKLPLLLLHCFYALDIYNIDYILIHLNA